MNHNARLIVDGPQDPLFNMACDEALGLCVSAPVLRFYQWEPPALSLGYFQKPEKIKPFMHQLDNPPAVRRITGGGAIYHFRELTYSIISPPGVLPLPSEIAESYRFLHSPFISVLNTLGVPAQDNFEAGKGRPAACFDRITPFDVTVKGRKILGSAQRRHKQYFLQHGSLPLEPNPFSERATSVQEELGSIPITDELIQLLTEAVSTVLGMEFRPDSLTEKEKETVSKLLSEKAVSVV